MQLRSTMWLAAAALLAALPQAGSAQQLQVFVFGDAGVVSQNNKLGPDGMAGQSLSLNSGPWQASRLGFRGKLKINDELDAWYDAATTVNLTQGLVGNPAPGTGFYWFDRNAFVGVASKHYGNLTFGRHPTPVTEALWTTDPLKANNGATNPNVRFGYFVGAGDLLLKNFGTNPATNGNGVGLDRQSNSAKYVFGQSGFLGMAMYGFGGQTGDRTKNQFAGALLGYDSDGTASHGPQDRATADVPNAFAVRLAAQLYGDNGERAGTALAPDVQTLYAYTAGAVGRMGPLKLKATWAYNTIDSSAAYYKKVATQVVSGGVTYTPFADLDLTAAVYNVHRTADGQEAQDAYKFYFVPEYYVTKNFWVYGIVDYEKLNTSATATLPGLSAGGNTSGAITPGLAGPSTLYLAVGVSFYFNS